MSMLIKNVRFTREQLKAMQLCSKDTGMNMSEIVRRAVDAYLLKLKTRKKQGQITLISEWMEREPEK